MVPTWLLRGRLGNEMFQLAYIYAQQRRGLIPDIWLQYPEYFAGSEDYIKQVFGQDISRSPLPYVSIHVRRGDYVPHPLFVNLWETRYYERAIALFPEDNFLVFSDDTLWCQRKWGNDPRFSVIGNGRTDIEDMNQMASCKSNIIANSSFSWWAAYLNPNPQKQVIYPQEWHTDGVARVGFPKGWICL
jgi:glycosyl transferase family 11